MQSGFCNFFNLSLENLDRFNLRILLSFIPFCTKLLFIRTLLCSFFPSLFLAYITCLAAFFSLQTFHLLFSLPKLAFCLVSAKIFVVFVLFSRVLLFCQSVGPSVRRSQSCLKGVLHKIKTF